MFNKPHDVTAQAVVEFTRNVFKTVAEKYGGGCTLNEVSVRKTVLTKVVDPLDHVVNFAAGLLKGARIN